MDELIFKQVLLAEYDKHHVGPPGGARKLIEEAPAVDAVPVIHGRWESYWSEEYWTHFHSCSVCLAPALTKEETMHDEVLSNYCPNCGAMMDLEETY